MKFFQAVLISISFMISFFLLEKSIIKKIEDKKIYCFFLELAYFFILGCSQVRAENINWIRDLNQAEEIARTQDKPILIDFYTDWCGWCKRLDKDTYGNDKVIEFAKKFICVKINADDNPKIAKQYNVRGFPSTVFLKADGTLMELVAGYMPAAEFLKLMEKIIANLSG